MAVLLISSELEEVVEGADSVIVLRDGAVVGRLSGPEVSQDGVMALIAAAAEETATAAPDAIQGGVEADSPAGPPDVRD